MKFGDEILEDIQITWKVGANAFTSARDERKHILTAASLIRFQINAWNCKQSDYTLFKRKPFFARASIFLT